MATKVVYFTISERKEQIEFRQEDSSEDMRETFRAAAEAGPNDILKLHNHTGSLLNISPNLPENTRETRYKLEVVAIYCPNKSVSIQSQLGFDMNELEKRVIALEKKMAQGNVPEVVFSMKDKLNDLITEIEGVKHLSWLGLFKDISRRSSLQPFWEKQASRKHSDHHNLCVQEKFSRMDETQVTEDVREYLRKPTFDNWQWDDAEMLILLRQMYIDLGLLKKYSIEIPVINNWLFQVYKSYNQVPFHNFKHCFMVAQMMYGLTWLIDLPSILDDVDILTLITSAICHDLDHPGYNNAYQINARTELALRYNDISPLENHHCAEAFKIIDVHRCNIFSNMSNEQYRRVREGMIKCILATDMAKHNEILHSFKNIIPTFDASNKEHISVLKMILMKVSDISNEARPLDVATPWVDCLLQEFFNQSDMEKLEGLPVAPFMDREKVTKPTSQIGFIKFVLLPLFESLGALFPKIVPEIVLPVQRALQYYTDMQHAEEKRKENSKGTNKQNGIATDSGGSS